MTAKNALTYKDSGVDIDAGNRLVELIKPAVAGTQREEVKGDVGGFGGLFAVPERFKQPVLVAGTDGVGTKLRLAIDHRRHEKIGIDLVAMCVNDVLVQGAEPLFFLDYFATGELETDVAVTVIEGIAAGCREAKMALLGGETAEMPGMYRKGDYDLAGFCVGAVERDRIIDGSRIEIGDQLIGLASTGPHSNGYSLIRKIVDLHPGCLQELIDGETLLDRLLTPTRIYTDLATLLFDHVDVLGMAHITGGGISENVPRVLPRGLQAHLYRERWPQPKVFDWLQQAGGVTEKEMLRTFNCGLGMILIVAPGQLESTMDRLTAGGQPAFVVGELSAGDGGVVVH